MAAKASWDQYGEYLDLEKLLGAQRPRSGEPKKHIHDEMLFIQFHQIYEIWFKQVLFELDDIQERLAHNPVSERDMQPILTYLGRIVEIFKQLEGMIDVLETMPPQSFTDFREFLGTASGFQSAQFRLIETRLGLQRKTRLPVFHGQFDQNLVDASKRMIEEAEKTPSLFEQLDSWLSRTPFVNLEGYAFQSEFRAAIAGLFEAKAAAAKESLSGEALTRELETISRGLEKFEGIFDEKKHDSARDEGRWRLSLKALQAALFITCYRDEPILQAPYNLLQRVMDVDALLARWRFRHALMVQRMVGFGMGTGGSSGAEYLMNTVQSHRIFMDLFALSTYLIPSRMLPKLPDEVRHKMSYIYSAKA